MIKYYSQRKENCWIYGIESVNLSKLSLYHKAAVYTNTRAVELCDDDEEETRLSKVLTTQKNADIKLLQNLMSNLI